MDEDGLSLYERRSNNTPLVYIAVHDMDMVHIEQLATLTPSKQAKSEDVCVVILTTKLNDRIYIR
jgi:hypothetical protein